MHNRFRKARESRGYTTRHMAGKMHVDISTITSWERGARKIPVDKLAEMADILAYSTDYLLGYDKRLLSFTEPLPPEKLFLMHGCPVWLASHGWALVNTPRDCLVLPDGKTLPMEGVSEPIFCYPPGLALSLHGYGMPLQREDVNDHEAVWVEPITVDRDLGAELRGWYGVHERFVQNEFGCRFYLDTYGAKWLAFEGCMRPDESNNGY